MLAFGHPYTDACLLVAVRADRVICAWVCGDFSAVMGPMPVASA